MKILFFYCACIYPCEEENSFNNKSACFKIVIAIVLKCLKFTSLMKRNSYHRYISYIYI